MLRGFQWKYIVVDEGHRLKVSLDSPDGQLSTTHRLTDSFDNLIASTEHGLQVSISIPPTPS